MIERESKEGRMEERKRVDGERKCRVETLKEEHLIANYEYSIQHCPSDPRLLLVMEEENLDPSDINRYTFLVFINYLYYSRFFTSSMKLCF